MSKPITMTEEKYYVPEISEFRHNFEYQWNVGIAPHVEWMDFSVSLSCDLGNINDHINAGAIRVRYLSEQDILGEGWRKDETLSVSKFFYDRGDDVFDFNNWGRELDFIIRKKITSDVWSVVFQGTIRNINELRMIQKMCGIQKS
jgi:hypothetical protein